MGGAGLVRRVAVPDMVQTHGYTIEEAARLGRYRALAGVAREVGAQVVAVGHTADDQAETVLMRWLRGSGLTGLQGMRPRMWWANDAEGQEGQAGVWVTRPWLHIWRTQLEDYVKLVGLEPCHDNSNQDMRFFRNRVRQEVLPFLAQYNPQIRPQLAQLAELVAGDEALLVGLTEQAWGSVVTAVGDGWIRFDRARWAEQDVALQRRLLRRGWQTVLRRQMAEVGFPNLEQVRQIWQTGQVGQVGLLPQGVRAGVGYGSFWLAVDTAVLPPELFAPQLPNAQGEILPVPGQIPLADGWLLRAEWVAGDVARAEQAMAHEAYLALPPETTALWVRGRRKGEQFRPFGMGGHKVKLKALMVNRKIPAPLRDRWPLVLAGDEVVWVAGQGQAAHTAVFPSTPHMLHLQILPPTPPSESREPET
jgi:tRNA(Ile)-lysidine synthase